MQRSILIGLVLILSLLAVQPVAAGGSAPREIEKMTLQFERLFRPMLGAIDARGLVFTDHRNGFLSLSYSLGSARPTGIGARSAAESELRTLSCGHMAAEPINPAALVNAVISDLETDYNFWWTVVNMTDIEETRKTTVKVTGPGGFHIQVSDAVPYGGNAVHLVWFNPETPFTESGVYTHRTLVKGGGKATYRFFAEAASTTTLER